jgi:hypothetical protein
MGRVRSTQAGFGVLAVLTLACAGYTPYLLRVPGVVEPMPYQESAAAQLAGLSRQAAAQMGCSGVSIARKGKILRAEGCSKQVLYVRVVRDVRDDRGYFGATLDFIDLAAASTDLPALHAQDQSEARALVGLSTQGAVDLDCPRREVVPEMVSLGHGAYAPVAEGCGRRATYVPGRLTDALRFAGRVDAPGAGNGFTPWDGGPW